MEKVKLPREVAEAIEALRKRAYDDSYILRASSIRNDDENWLVVYYFVNTLDNNKPDNIFLLADALRHGYIVDEPITVTITPEQQGKIRRYYTTRTYEGDYLETFRDGFRSCLGLLGIKIPGVNDQ